MHRIVLAVCLTLGAAAGTAAAQPTTPAPAPAAPPVRAVRSEHPVVVDGVLDEPVWKSDNAVTGFLQSDPDQGSPPRQKTEVRVAYDDDALYVGARMYDTAPDSVVSALARRDNDAPTDGFAVFLDPYHDKRTGYYFGVTAAGTLLDGVLMNDSWDDSSWDGVWHAHVKRDAQGWTAEMKIPFSQLRFQASTPMVWGVNFQRDLNRHRETDKLVYTPRDGSGYVSRFPDLVGLEGVHPHRTIEITPYVTTKTEHLRYDSNSVDPFDPADPFHGGWEAEPTLGGDVRTSLGPNLTLNATVNPDFGQVEIDPAVVNLSDVESFFDEKRPFFTEGVSVFRCGNNGANDYPGFNWPEPIFFYSRRIGRAPQADTPAADFVDRPLATHILGAAKITGQPIPGWKFGTLAALTQEEKAKLQTSGLQTRSPVEPMSTYGVIRALHEMNDRRQGIGLMTTIVAREFDKSSGLDTLINRSGVVTALDGWTFLDKKRTWVVSGWAAGSRVDATPKRLADLQSGSLHYFQRPDRADLGVDPNASSLAGWGSRLWLNKQEGPLMLNVAAGAISPGFDNNDLGFLFRTDVINAHVFSGWQWLQPNGWRQYANLLGALCATWDFAGNSTLKGVWMGANVEQRNRWSWNASNFLTLPGFSERKTRGGPLMATKLASSPNLYFDTDGQKPFFWYVSANPSFNADGSWSASVNPGIRWRPMTNLSFEAGPEVYRGFVNAQFWDNSGTLATGSRFAHLDQTQLGGNLRMDYAITPNLSLQLYAQPLVSTVRYYDLKELARSRSYDLLSVDPAFEYAYTFASARGNVVVRWEYMPGSTMFVVWTHDRADLADRNEFDLNRSFAELGRAPSNDVFLVKLSHHFEL